MPDYATWMLLWWASLATLLLAFALVDGFDLGIALLLPLLGRTDAERSACLQVVGPRSEGNGLWLLVGGGAFMAAWPFYATSFSIYWLALALTLGALFLRPLGFELRPLIPERVRPWWDRVLCVAGLAPAACFGLACGALFAPEASVFSPFGLFCALLSVLLLAMHGAAMLVVRTRGLVRERARHMVVACALALATLLVAGGLWLNALPGPDDPRSLPPYLQPGGWLNHYYQWPALWLIPLAGLVSLLACAWSARRSWRHATWACSCLGLTTVMCSGALALFPFVLPPGASISSVQLWQAAVSHRWLPGLVLPALLLLTTLAVVRQVRSERSHPLHENAGGYRL